MNPREQFKATSAPGACPLCHGKSAFAFAGKDFLHGGDRVFQYQKCNSCGCEYQHPAPTRDQIASFYPDTYMIYSENRKPGSISPIHRAALRSRYGYDHLSAPIILQWMAGFISWVRYRDSISYVPKGSGLDVGCGNGKFMVTMNSLGWRFQGVEFNDQAVEICRKSNLAVFHGDLLEAGFPNAHFDLITARHLIEHLPDPHGFMREISRILKRNGRLVVQTPNSQALGRKWFGKYWYANDVPRHLVLFSPVNLRQLASQYGLVQVVSRTFTTPKIFLNSWDYWVKNSGKPSRKRGFKRLLTKPYVLLAQLSKRGDELFGIYEKR